MNVQVDLILPDEQRNASAFNMQALVRISSIIVPSIIILSIILITINFTKTKNELKNLEVQWQTIKLRKDKADKLRNQRSANREILSKLNGLRNSRLEWSKQLVNLMAITPDNIQFRRLSVSQTLQLENKKYPARIYNVLLSGKAIGDKVDIAVAGFTKTLYTDKNFAPYMDNTQVTDYDKDNSPDAKKSDRAFTISCSYKPRIFE